MAIYQPYLYSFEKVGRRKNESLLRGKYTFYSLNR